MKSDKFLIGIVVGVVLLVVVAVVIILTRTGVEEYVADDTPAGVVHNYFLALERNDFERAYGYLSDELEAKPNLDEFIRQMNYNRSEAALKIGESTITDNRARVEVAITIYSGGGPFSSNSYTNRETANLKLSPEGEWKLMWYPHPYWGYQWNEPIRK
jgi:DNA-binding protein Fis